MDFMATWMTKIYNTFVVIPRWIMIIASGGAASLVLGLLHRSSGKQEPTIRPQAKTTTQANPTPVATRTVASSSGVAATEQEAPARRTSARQRKNKK